MNILRDIDCQELTGVEINLAKDSLIKRELELAFQTILEPIRQGQTRHFMNQLIAMNVEDICRGRIAKTSMDKEKQSRKLQK